MRRTHVSVAILVALTAALLAPGAPADPHGLGNTITVEKRGNGSGTVTSSPAGISCGRFCSATFPPGVLVKLTATPAPGSTFTGWNGGGCVGTGSCTTGATAGGTIVATFSTAGYTLSVNVRGSGRVSSSPAGIACPARCDHTFASGTQVSLRARPRPGAEFLGWGGECSGRGGCVVAITRAQSVTARFSVANVEAAIVSTRFRQSGPPGARRVLRVRVEAGETLARIAVRVRRAGVTLASVVVRDVDRGTSVVRVPLRNAVAPGSARVHATFTSATGARATQSRAIRIPALR